MINLMAMIAKHEGLSLRPYKDSVGFTTIGYGRNLDSVGISKDEAEFMLKNDIAVAVKELLKIFPNFVGLTQNRQNALIDMMYNLGSSRFRGFYRMIKAIVEERFQDAAQEMLQSRWATQVGQRAAELSALMREG